MSTTFEEKIGYLWRAMSDPSPAYIAKQIHAVPAASVVDRTKFIVDRCRGKIVLDIGASGQLHANICKCSVRCYGIDREDGDGVAGCNLDAWPVPLPAYPDVGVVVCGEVLEHLSNPGHFLEALATKYRVVREPWDPPSGRLVEFIFTVPNALSDVGRHWMAKGTENVNNDHVAYYSYHTLKTLLGRHGFAVKEHYWYKGRPRFSEGLIFVARA